MTLNRPSHLRGASPRGLPPANLSHRPLAVDLATAAYDVPDHLGVEFGDQ